MMGMNMSPFLLLVYVWHQHKSNARRNCTMFLWLNNTLYMHIVYKYITWIMLSRGHGGWREIWWPSTSLVAFRCRYGDFSSTLLDGGAGAGLTRRGAGGSREIKAAAAARQRTRECPPFYPSILVEQRCDHLLYFHDSSRFRPVWFCVVWWNPRTSICVQRGKRLLSAPWT